MDDGWSLDELTDRVAHALASDGVRAPNGRVREVPDARAIRWYTTIGLVDRPLVGPRRAARYTGRHLLQVVAVKRLQAQGRSLAEIQAALVGATESTLRAAARLPESGVPADVEELAVAAPGAPAAGAAPAAAPATAPAAGPDAAPPPVRGRFWSRTPGLLDGSATPVPAPAPTPAPAPAPAPTVQYVVPLPGGVGLTLPAAPTGADLVALQEAAAPLLQLLAARGLTAGPEPGTDGRPADG